jgi:transposase
MGVAIGIDSHKRSLAVAVVDDVGRPMEVREFANDPRGHRALLRWARRFGDGSTIGIEGFGNFGAGVSKYLLDAGEDVREVPANLTFRERNRKTSKAKSDPHDAVAIARVVARDDGLGSAAKDQLSDDLKVLVDHRDQLVRARTMAANRIHKHLTVLYPGYGDRIPRLTGKRHVAAVVRLLQRDSSVRADIVRRHIKEVRRLDDEITHTGDQIEAKINQIGTSLTQLRGVGVMTAAKILGELGNCHRIRSKAAFGMLTGTAPLAASSGVTSRHRFNRGGNRQLNYALHTIAINCLRLDPETRLYIDRKRAEGKSKKEAMRCLKRHLANVVYRQLTMETVHATTISA